MSLINELKAKSDTADCTKQEIIEEIKAYFDKYLDGDGLENHLRKTISASEIKERKTFTKVEFWEYHSGCTTTVFRCGGKCWYNPENRDGWKSHKYKGVELISIHKEVCSYLSDKLEKRMRELGFEMVSKEDQKSRLGYYDTHYYFGW